MLFVPHTGADFLVLAANILIILILAEAIVSNIIAFGGKISPYNKGVRTLRKIVNPILDPFRKMLPPRTTGGWDLSPMIVMILLQVVAGMLRN